MRSHRTDKEFLSEAIASVLPDTIIRHNNLFRHFEIDGEKIVAVDWAPGRNWKGPRPPFAGEDYGYSPGGVTRTVVGEVPTDVIAGLHQLARQFSGKAEAEAAKKKAAESDREEWIASLPARLDADTLVDKIQGALVDNVGNYLIGLPKCPVADLSAWAAEKLVDFDGD